MKFGLFGGALTGKGGSGDSLGYQRFIDYMCAADELGFHSIFVVEHHFTGIGQVSATLTLLANLAARTKRIRLGTGVTVLPWHNPVLLAEQIATLDLLSGGRADIGVGKGYRPKEFEGFDIPIEEAEQRYEENLDLLVASLTSQERFSHKSKHWSFNDIIVEPRPLQRPHPPIWVGAASPSSIARTAERGFNLLLDQWSTASEIAGRVALYRESRLAHGRGFVADQVGVTRSVKILDSDEERTAAIQARAKFLIEAGAGGAKKPDSPDAAWRTAESSAVIGSSDQVIERIKELQAGGVEYLLLSDAATSPSALRRFAEEVMPEFADTPDLALT